MSLKSKITRVDNKFHTDTFRRALEDHLSTFQVSAKVVTISSASGLKYKDNFTGLLTYLNIPPKYRYSTQRLNKIVNPRQVGVLSSIYVPDYKDIDDLLSTLQLAERDLF